MNYILLGETGFVGKNLIARLRRQNKQISGFNRSKFDITKEETFASVKLSNQTTILDCISKIDGAPEDIFTVNYYGIKKFIEYLNAQNSDYTYLYISTCGTLFTQLMLHNPYLDSKFQAEDYIKNNCKSYKIIRLMFPFGIGENKNRLISKLISKAISNDEILLDSLTCNLTPITTFISDFEQMLNSTLTEINYATGYSYKLTEIIDFIFRTLNKPSHYKTTQKILSLVVTSDIPSTSHYNDVFSTIEEMILYEG